MPRPIVVTYLMEYTFTFIFASLYSPEHVRGALSVTTFIGVVTLTFDLLICKRFTGYAHDGFPTCQFWGIWAC